jgi:polyvinyl alcohol dehydrogenase (cytochrome)
MRRYTLFAVFIAAASLVIWVAASRAQNSDDSSQWPVAGHDIANTRSQPGESTINPNNVHLLAPKWVFTAAGDISATPTVFADAVYFPDWGGNLNAVRQDNGQLIWSKAISSFDGFTGAVSRDSPAAHGGDLIFGDLESSTALHNGANVIAVSRHTGAMHWMTQVEKHPAAVITGPPVVFGDTVYVGVSSREEFNATQAGYPCCTFRGSVVALDANSGKMLWQTYVMPDNGGKTDGYSGGAVWQPPAIDPSRGLLYIGTGNNYTVPAAALTCAEQGGSNCTATDDYFDTALALDLRTGQIRWAKGLQKFDDFTVDCIIMPSNCPAGTDPDYDLGGSGPNLLPTFVGFGQKSGIYWALDPDDGHVLWSTTVGPGGTLGGIEWGTATDGQRIYASIGNNTHQSYNLVPTGTAITWGSWSGLDAGTGKLLWQTADPTPNATDQGAVSVANGVVYAGSTAGSMYALDALSGNILWSFASGGSVLDGPSIVNGVVYWGSGYRLGTGGHNTKVYAFTVPQSR